MVSPQAAPRERVWMLWVRSLEAKETKRWKLDAVEWGPLLSYSQEWMVGAMEVDELKKCCVDGVDLLTDLSEFMCRGLALFKMF